MTKHTDETGTQTGDPRVADINARYTSWSARACSAYSRRLNTAKAFPYRNLQRKLNELDRMRLAEIAALTPRAGEASLAPTADPPPTADATAACAEAMTTLVPEPGAAFMEDPKPPRQRAARVRKITDGLQPAAKETAPAESKPRPPAPAKAATKKPGPADSTQKPSAPPAPRVVTLPVAEFSLTDAQTGARRVLVEIARAFAAAAVKIPGEFPRVALNAQTGRDAMTQATRRVYNDRMLRLNRLQNSASEKIVSWQGKTCKPLDEARTRLLETAGYRAASAQLEQIQIWIRAVQGIAAGMERAIDTIYKRCQRNFQSVLRADLQEIDRLAPTNASPDADVEDGGSTEDAA